MGADAGVPIAASWVTGRSVPAALLEQVEALDADMIVVGSGANGAPGRVAMTAKTDRLLHSSPVPVAIAPEGMPRSRVLVHPGHRRVPRRRRHVAPAPAGGGHLSSHRCLAAAGDRRPRPTPMYTAAVSGAEDLVREQWRRQASVARTKPSSTWWTPASPGTKWRRCWPRVPRGWRRSTASSGIPGRARRGVLLHTSVDAGLPRVQRGQDRARLACSRRRRPVSGQGRSWLSGEPEPPVRR